MRTALPEPAEPARKPTARPSPRAAPARRAEASEAPRKRTPPAPVSAYPPLALQRPLQVFGSGFEVHLSTALTLSPDTAMRAVLDTSLQSFLRKEAPGRHLLLRKLHYALAGKHRPTRSTQALIQRELALFTAPQLLDDALQGKASHVSLPPESDWASLLRGMNGRADVLLQDLAAQLAERDARLLAWCALASGGQRAEAEAGFTAEIEDGLAAWKALNPRLTQQVFPVLESTLRTLSWLECRHAPAQERQPDSLVTPLLASGRRPQGHWLDEVRRAAGCPSLKALGELLLRGNVRHHGRIVEHDQLRKWSSGRSGLMSAKAMEAVVQSVRIADNRQTLRNRYYLMRLVTFLCDLVHAGTVGEAPLWADVQAQINRRYSELHRSELLEAANVGDLRS